ncbi:MAG: hypothetical protein U0T36_09255 [Saprospiraceae bacterium]
MISTSETGHIKNVSFFEDLITYCQSYGPAYNPSNDMFKLPQLQTKMTAAQTAINNLKIKKTSFDNATNARRTVFEDIKRLSTRIINALIVSGASELTIADARGINKKMQGSSSKKTESSTTETESTSVPKSISTSQQSYDRIKDHLANFIQVLQQEPTYNPNENDLKIAYLQTKVTQLETAKTQWINAYTEYSNTMIDRNNVMYDKNEGMVNIAIKVKLYIKSLFGAKSPQYFQISNLHFKNYK